MGLHVRVRCIARHVIDQAQPMHTTHGSVMPLVREDTSGVLRRLHLREQRCMNAFFDPKHIAQMVVVQGLSGRGLGTQALFRHEKLEVRVALAQRGNEALGGLAFALIFLRAIVLHNGFGHPRHHCTHVRRANRCAQPLVLRGDRPVAVPLWQTRRPMHGLGGERPCAIEGHSIMALQQRHWFQRRAALAWPKDAFAQGAEGRGEGRIKALAPLRVARGVCSIPARVCNLPSIRCLAKARREDDGRENIANAAMSASVQAISASPQR